MKIPQPNEIRKPSKTLAGVTPIAVMCRPKKCRHGTCVYCPSLNVPQSYTPKSPPVLRASRLSYDAFEQVKSRLKAFKLMNHPTGKIEIIIMGGDFLGFSVKYQEKFVKNIYDALNCRKSKSLEEAKNRNQKTKHRCVALCIETRPDSINKKSVQRILGFGCTRVELGVQCLDDKIYKKVKRGHLVEDVIEATEMLKNNSFKVGYHMMLGLPGSNARKDLEMFKKLFKDERFKPDQLKIYPCQVIEGSVLSNWHKKGKYKPYSKVNIQKLIIKIMKIIPNYCRVMRIMREIPPDYLVSGTTRIDLRKDIDDELKKEKIKINEIRFREIGFAIRDLKPGKKVNNKLKLKVSKYQSSGGEEYFLEFVNKDDILFGLARLRVFGESLSNNKDNTRGKRLIDKNISNLKNKTISKSLEVRGVSCKNTENKKIAFVREVHVYGKALGIGEKAKMIGQHSGLGKKLMKEIEDICKKEKVKELKVISGVGVREYYKKLGYKLDKEKTYMIKE
ncbi:MAG: tRNA uridine(34) 5-carboxymethylaminomethyl modification radical SAM/GNAT enzyme Elp3, partial [archaeon]